MLQWVLKFANNLSLVRYLNSKMWWHTHCWSPWYLWLTHHWFQKLRVSHIISIGRVLFCTFVRMPAYCIAYDCENDQCNASLTVSCHHLPLKKPLLLKQVRIALNCVKQWLQLSPPTSLVAREAMAIVDPPILYEANAHVCSDNFVETCYVSSVLEGFGPSRWTLKPDTVPTVFAFNSPPKGRKLSEARLARAEHTVRL